MSGTRPVTAEQHLEVEQALHPNAQTSSGSVTTPPMTGAGVGGEFEQDMIAALDTLINDRSFAPRIARVRLFVPTDLQGFLVRLGGGDRNYRAELPSRPLRSGSALGGNENRSVLPSTCGRGAPLRAACGRSGWARRASTCHLPTCTPLNTIHIPATPATSAVPNNTPATAAARNGPTSLRSRYPIHRSVVCRTVGTKYHPQR